MQRVREPECWAVGDFLWRAPPPGCAGKQGPGFRQISLSGIRTCLLVLTMLVGWRWSRMACLSFGGSQLAINTTLVSPVRADGEPRGQCARQDGAALAEAHRLKHRTYPELSGSQGRARLVVLAAEVGGRWSEEARSFVSQLARAKVRSLPRVLRGRARQAWQHRWSAILSCASVCLVVAGSCSLGVRWRHPHGL